MELREAEIMYQVEMDHWWFVGKRLALRSILEGLPSPPPGPLMDVGCGAGAVLTELAKYGPALGLDYLFVCLELANRRGDWPLMQASADTLPLRNGSMGLVTCLDVMTTDSIDACRALDEFYRVLAPGGYLILFDPAYQGLVSSHDAAFNQFKRPAKSGQIVRVEHAGFEVLRATYRNTALAPAIICARLLRKFMDRFHGENQAGVHSDVDTPPPAWLNKLFGGLLQIEARILRKRDFPFGISVCVLARKPG